MTNIPTSTFEQRLAETLRRTLPKLGPATANQVAMLMQPEALAIVAAVLVAWIVSHAFGIGEIIDVVMIAGGLIAVGTAIFTGIDHLYAFATRTYNGRSTSDFEQAAQHLADAIAILGIQAVIAVLFRGARPPRTGGGQRFSPGPAPLRTPGLRYKPQIRQDPRLPAGHGNTSFYGDMTVSALGSATDRAVVLLHEKVHQFLAPKLYLLRGYRVRNRVSSYSHSSLWRATEEALAETIAQVGINGFKQLMVGIRFPVSEGYVYMTRGGGYSHFMQGHGVKPELTALIYTGVVASVSIELHFMPATVPAATPGIH